MSKWKPLESLCFGLAALCAVAAVAPGTPAAAKEGSVTVSISIKVSPIAEINFPRGTDFVLKVPKPETGAPAAGENLPRVERVRIPFVVRGNATALVHAEASEIQKSHDGTKFGVARMISDRSRTLTYMLDMNFPSKSKTTKKNTFSRISRGNIDTASRYASANVADGPSNGFVSVIPNFQNAARSGHGTYNGTYSGSVNLTITANE